jgi:thioesterase domain-containing protein/acyl carrier protein
MVPGRVVALDVLPRLPNGKVDRRALADTRSSTPTPPTNELERRLVEVWQELLELPVGLDDDFFELGGDSLLVMEMLVEVEQRLSCKLSPGALLEARTPSSLAALICGLRSGRQRHTGNAGRDRPRLYFTYSIGGTGLRYRALVDALGDDLPVHALDAPWWDGRPSELQTVEQLAAHHITEIKELQPDGPYLLGGYSGGGLIALEIARQLGAAGEQIALLAVVDTPVGLQRSPFDPRSLLTAPPSSPGRLILRHLRLFLATQRYRATAAGRRMARLARRPRSWIDLRRLGEVPERHRPSYVHDRIIAALAAYRPLPYEGHVTLCRCPASSAFPADCGWGTMARGGLTIHDLAGTHLEVLDPPFVEQLALLLADAIHTGVDRPAAPARDAPTTQQEHQPV